MRMNEITKTIRALDSEAYRTFRAKAVELGYTTGQAMSEAMRVWLNAKNRPKMTLRAEVETATSTPTETAQTA